MNFSTSVFVINRDCRMVVCEYDPENPRDKRVNYKTLDRSITAGDLVVVPTDTRQKFTVVKVVETDVPVDFDAPGDVKWIIQKVDRDNYDKLISDEGVAIKTLQGAEQRRRAAEMQKLIIGDQDPAEIKGLSLYKNGDTANPPSAAPGQASGD